MHWFWRAMLSIVAGLSFLAFTVLWFGAPPGRMLVLSGCPIVLVYGLLWWAIGPGKEKQPPEACRWCKTPLQHPAQESCSACGRKVRRDYSLRTIRLARNPSGRLAVAVVVNAALVGILCFVLETYARNFCLWPFSERDACRIFQSVVLYDLLGMGILLAFFERNKARLVGLFLAAVALTTLCGVLPPMANLWATNGQFILPDDAIAVALVLSVFGLPCLWGCAGILDALLPIRIRSVHCPGCGYSLMGLPQQRCPECGRPFTFHELGVTAGDLQPSASR